VNDHTTRKKGIEIILHSRIEKDKQQGDNGLVELRAGDPCPNCKRARLDYNGLLNLTCPSCGDAFGSGWFT